MAMVINDPNSLPARCVLFLTDAFTGGPLESVPSLLRARLSTTPGDRGGRAPTPAAPPIDVVLGVLATDHVGFASWDLAPLIRRLRIEVDRVRIASIPGASLVLDALTIRLAGPLNVEIEALNPSQMGGNAFVVTYGADPQAVFQLGTGTFPAIQSPSLVDWYLSPASFSYLPAAMIGADGCEALLPSNVSTQRFQAYQIINLEGSYAVASSARTVDALSATRLSTGITPRFTIEAAGLIAAKSPELLAGLGQSTESRLAVLVVYDITWLPVGHGLGQILYSLPLAPGEQVNIAVVDWARSDTASRQEDTGLSDTLVHDTLRDRTVGEVVDASLREYQRGSSTMAGGSVTGGYPGVIGGSVSLGTTYST